MAELNEIGTYWIDGPIMTALGMYLISFSLADTFILIMSYYLVSAMGQIFYAWRIWVLRKNIWIPAAIVTVSSIIRSHSTHSYSGRF